MNHIAEFKKKTHEKIDRKGIENDNAANYTCSPPTTNSSKESSLVPRTVVLEKVS